MIARRSVMQAQSCLRLCYHFRGLKSLVGSLDQGTSSTRFILLNRDGVIISQAQLEHKQIYPQPGWVENDPMEIWGNTERVIQMALQKAQVSTEDLAAVGITNQRETTVIWDKETGRPLYNAILWNDARTAPLAGALADEFGGQDALRPVTGLPISSYFSALKIRWLFDNVPGVKEACDEGRALFGTMDTWLLWNLTRGEVHVTDVTNACRTLLLNLERLEWDQDLLAKFGVPRDMLPSVKSSCEVYGTAASSTALDGVPLSGILGDQQAALFGQGCFTAGEAKATYGTGCFIMMNTGEKIVPSTHGLLSTVAFRRQGQPPVYALEGAVAYSGSLIQWLRDQLGLMKTAKETDELAAEDNGGVYFVPAFNGLLSPHWREDARGVICGLTAYNHKGHLIRAAVEASAFQALDVLRAMELDSSVALQELRIDGGMAASAILPQFQADMAMIPVTRPKQLETTAMGAGFAAGLAVGFWRDLDEIGKLVVKDARWEPMVSVEQRDETYGYWKKGVDRAKGWVEDRQAHIK